MNAASLTISVAHDFPDEASAIVWQDLAQKGDIQTIFLTWHYQRAWWESFGRGELLLLLATHQGRPIALAPLFHDSAMIFFVGSGGSDYLDFLGDIRDPDVLTALLDTARGCVPGFLGFRFYHIPDRSSTGASLRVVAERLGLVCYDEGDLPAPLLDLTVSGAGTAAIGKKSLVRHETYFRREGGLTVTHLSDGEAILPHLDAFFEQHRSRWAVTPYPSLFLDPAQCAFYRRLTTTAARTGWLRFTRLDWQGLPIAFHFGFCHGGRFLWYKPSFAIDLAHRSPGEVLLRQLLIAAVEEGAHTFDFGLGDEPFKHRFVNRLERVRTWGLYPVGTEGGNLR